MSNKTINQALKDLFLGLGGNPSDLSDNTSVSDYIEDLEGAIKGEASSIIDDSAASESKVYSSSKVESLIPSPELPSATSADSGKYLTVNSQGAWVKSSNTLGAVKLGDISYSDDTLTITLNSSAGVWNRANVENLLRTSGFGSYYFTYNNNDWCRLPVACIAYDQGVENFVVIGYFYNPSVIPAKYQKITVFINKDNESYDKIFIEEITPA